MKILITGASSYTGARIYSDLKNKFDVVGTYKANKLFPELEQLDITDQSSVDQVIKKIKPNVIVHIAARSSDSECKENPKAAKLTNADGTKNIVSAADNVLSKVIYISSIAAVDPINLYGKTKLAGEEFTKQAKKGYIILRPSLIIGQSPNTMNDRPHNRILKNITDKIEPIYDTSWKFQPTWLGHLSETIETVLEKDIMNEIIPVAVPELKSRYDIADDILSNFDITAIPIDKKISSYPPIKLDKLRDLSLPEYTYGEILSKVVDEMGVYLNST